MSDKKKEDESSSSVPPSSSSIEDNPLQSVKASVKQGLRSAVATTNRALAQIEETVKGPVATTWHQANEAASTAAAYTVEAYERRHEYGPAAIAVSSLAVGGVTALRRGRLPGAVAAALAGGATYGIVYGLDGLELPEQFKKK